MMRGLLFSLLCQKAIDRKYAYLKDHIIADYECYDKTNEDEDRDVLKDLSGNGHDITLYNFGFAEGSGYGLYNSNLDYVGSNSTLIAIPKEGRTYKKVEFVMQKDIMINGNLFFFRPNTTKVVKIKCNKNFIVKFQNEFVIDLEANKIIELPVFTQEQVDSSMLYSFFNNQELSNGEEIIFEQIPEYPGALVSDGVDDYGLCENFPILNSTDGYTVLAIRRIPEEQFSKLSSFIAKGTKVDFSESEFVFDFNFQTNKLGAVSFGKLNQNLIEAPDLFSYQTSKLYNGKSLTQGAVTTEINKLGLFRYVAGNGSFGTYALYRVIILNKDCTTEEIKFLAKQMVAKHKEKTGETIELNF